MVIIYGLLGIMNFVTYVYWLAYSNQHLLHSLIFACFFAIMTKLESMEKM